MTTETAAGEMKTSNDRAERKKNAKKNRRKKYKAHTQATAK